MYFICKVQTHTRTEDIILRKYCQNEIFKKRHLIVFYLQSTNVQIVHTRAGDVFRKAVSKRDTYLKEKTRTNKRRYLVPFYLQVSVVSSVTDCVSETSKENERVKGSCGCCRPENESEEG